MLHRDFANQKEELEFYDKQISPLLLTGADVVVADEGHVIKNPATDKARALMRIKTKKRVALTGYPLQNRLIEYYTMVNWVQKGLLEEEEDFKMNFVAPITLGELLVGSKVQIQCDLLAHHQNWQGLKPAGRGTFLCEIVCKDMQDCLQ